VLISGGAIRVGSHIAFHKSRKSARIAFADKDPAETSGLTTLTSCLSASILLQTPPPLAAKALLVVASRAPSLTRLNEITPLVPSFN
jgi:hypothetical protein